MASVYGEDVAQTLADETWLTDAGNRGWIVHRKDDAIRRRPAERDALADAAVRAFCLTNANLRAIERCTGGDARPSRIRAQASTTRPFWMS